jgi:hypothetical protein
MVDFQPIILLNSSVAPIAITSFSQKEVDFIAVKVHEVTREVPDLFLLQTTQPPSQSHHPCLKRLQPGVWQIHHPIHRYPFI